MTDDARNLLDARTRVRKDILLPSMARLYAEGVGWYASMIRIANRSPLTVSIVRGAMQILLDPGFSALKRIIRRRLHSPAVNLTTRWEVYHGCI